MITFEKCEPDDYLTEAIESIVEAAADFESVIALRCEPSREKSLAMMKLEECVMWANKALVVHGVWTDSEGC